ncbi:MAG: outer membrane protein assembly factor BamD [Candidatus Omnitrophota bacterium]|jgi:outer membrane protein assembly factor BamD
MKPLKYLLLSAFLLTAFINTSHAAWLWSPGSGKWSNAKDVPQDTPEAQFFAAKIYFEKDDFKRAIDEFNKVIKHFPRSNWAAEAQYYIGLTYEKMDNAGKAADAYRVLTDRYPYSERLNDATEREFELAEKMMAGKKTRVLGLEIMPAKDVAANLYEHIVKVAPYGPYGAVAQYRLGDAELETGNFDEAQVAYQTTIDEYPNSEYAEKAKYKLAQITFDAALDEQYHETRMDEAVTRYEGFKKSYPDSELELDANDAIKELRSKKAENVLRTAEFYEGRGKFPSAKIYYQDVISGFPETDSAIIAKEKIQAIKDREEGREPKKPEPKKVKPKAKKEPKKKKFWLF